MSEVHCQQNRPLVTLAIPLRNEAQQLPALLACVRAQTWPLTALQIILVDGGSHDATPALARAAAATFPHCAVLDNPQQLAAAGLNLALQQARGAFFLRLDARSRPAPTYVERCVAHLQSGDWAGVGGAQVAVGHNRRSDALAQALNHRLGVGGARYRRAGVSSESETIYLGAYVRDWLLRVGGWNEHFAANEDYELNTRLRAAGGRLLVAADIDITYVARDSLRALARQYARYGRWRFVTWRRHPQSMRGRHWAPALWVAGLLSGLILLPISPWPLAIMLLPYLLLITLAALTLAVRQRCCFLTIWLAFPTIHLSWGLHFWRQAGRTALAALRARTQ